MSVSQISGREAHHRYAIPFPARAINCAMEGRYEPVICGYKLSQAFAPTAGMRTCPSRSKIAQIDDKRPWYRCGVDPLPIFAENLQCLYIVLLSENRKDFVVGVRACCLCLALAVVRHLDHCQPMPIIRSSTGPVCAG